MYHPSRKDITDAIIRGHNTPNNRDKPADPRLIEDVCNEIMNLIHNGPPQPTADDVQKAAERGFHGKGT